MRTVALVMCMGLGRRYAEFQHYHHDGGIINRCEAHDDGC